MAADSWEMAGEQKAPYNHLQLSGMEGRTEASFKTSTALVKGPVDMPTRLAQFSQALDQVGESGNSIEKVHLLFPKSWRAVAWHFRGSFMFETKLL